MKNERTIGIILSYVSLAINTIVNIVYVPILLHFLGKSEYGLYQLMGSFIAYFGVMDFGLSNTVVRYYSKYKALDNKVQMENVLAIAQRIYFVIDIIIIIVATIIYPLLDVIYGQSLNTYELSSTKQMYVIVIINILITISTNVYTAYITAQEAFVFLKLLSLIQTLVQPFVVILILTERPIAMSVVIVQTMLNLIANIIKIIFSYSKLKIKIVYHEHNRELTKSMLKFSASIFIVAITDQLFWKTNQLILGAVSGAIAVAIYGIASQIYMNYVSLSSVIQGVFLPRITELVTKNRDVNYVFIYVGRVQYIILSCVLGGFIAFGQEFIALWVGEEFLEAYYITLIIISAMTIDLIQSIGGTIMQAKNMYSVRAKVLFIMAIANVILAIFLGAKYGGMGCAVGTCICMVIGNGLVMNSVYKKKVGLNIVSFWRKIGKLTVPSLFTCIIGVFIERIFNTAGFLGLGIKIVVYLLIYICLIWCLGLETAEKCEIVTRLRNVRRKT